MLKNNDLVYVISIKVNHDDNQSATYSFQNREARNHVVREFLEKNPQIELTTFTLSKEHFEMQFGHQSINYCH